MSDVPIKPYERPTDDLRQVCVGGDPFVGEPKVRYYRVQRRWKVQDGEAYYAPTQRAATDILIGGWHPLEPNLGFRWMPVRSVWRDLPIVSEIEAEKDS